MVTLLEQKAYSNYAAIKVTGHTQAWNDVMFEAGNDIFPSEISPRKMSKHEESLLFLQFPFSTRNDIELKYWDILLVEIMQHPRC